MISLFTIQRKYQHWNIQVHYTEQSNGNQFYLEFIRQIMHFDLLIVISILFNNVVLC